MPVSARNGKRVKIIEIVQACGQRVSSCPASLFLSVSVSVSLGLSLSASLSLSLSCHLPLPFPVCTFPEPFPCLCYAFPFSPPFLFCPPALTYLVLPFTLLFPFAFLLISFTLSSLFSMPLFMFCLPFLFPFSSDALLMTLPFHFPPSLFTWRFHSHPFPFPESFLIPFPLLSPCMFCSFSFQFSHEAAPARKQANCKLKPNIYKQLTEKQ